MSRWAARKGNAGATDADPLRQLLQREEQVARRLEQARIEAERLVADARAYASESATRSEADVAHRLEKLRAGREQELLQAISALEAEAGRQARRYEALEPDRARELVLMVLETISTPDSRTWVDAA